MTENHELPGVWQATAATISGQTIPAEEIGAIRLTLTATRFTTTRGTETLFDSSYTADASKAPMEIQMIGTGGDFDGKAALGIYALEADVLRLCYKMPGFARPAAFESLAGSGAFLITLRRVG